MTNISLFSSSDTFEEFDQGQYVFRQGDAGKFMYIIKEGQVEVQIDDEPIRTLGEGQVFGEMALSENRPRSATAIAKTPCKLVAIDQLYFDFLLKNTAYFADDVTQIMTLYNLRPITEHIS